MAHLQALQGNSEGIGDRHQTIQLEGIETYHSKPDAPERVPTLAIKDQLRHTSVKTAVDFYIGSDESYQREMIEKLILNSGKLVGKDENSISDQLPTA